MAYVKKTTTVWRKLVEEQREDGVYRRCNKCDKTSRLCREDWKARASDPRGYSRYCRRCENRRNAKYARGAYQRQREAAGKTVRFNLCRNRKYWAL